MSKKLLYCRNGALIGLAVVFADYFFEWRGQKYVAWTDSNSIAYNVGQMIGSVGFAAIIGFLAGMLADKRRSKEI